MTNFRRFVAFSAFLTLAGFGSAQAATVAPGDYKLVAGTAAPCSLTLKDDGSASAGACVALGTASAWHPTGAGLELVDGGGTLLAVFHAKGDGYSGTSVADSAHVTLTPTAQTAAAH